MTVNHGVPGSSPGEGAKATRHWWLFCFDDIVLHILHPKGLIDLSGVGVR